MAGTAKLTAEVARVRDILREIEALLTEHMGEREDEPALARVRVARDKARAVVGPRGQVTG